MRFVVLAMSLALVGGCSSEAGPSAEPQGAAAAIRTKTPARASRPPPVARLVPNVERQRGGLDLPRPEPALAGAGDAFVAFARGGPADRLLLHHPVDLLLGGRLVHTIPAWRAVHRHSYGWLCPTSGSYAAYSCPFSAVRLLASHPGRVAVTSQAPEHPCLGAARTLAETRDRTVTLTPDESRDCTSYFAVELEVGLDGRLLAVNLVMSEP